MALLAAANAAAASTGDKGVTENSADASSAHNAHAPKGGCTAHRRQTEWPMALFAASNASAASMGATVALQAVMRRELRASSE